MDKEQYKQRLHTLVEQLKAQEDKELLDYLQLEVNSAILTNPTNTDTFIKLQRKNMRKKGQIFYKEIADSKLRNQLINDYALMLWYKTIGDIPHMFAYILFQIENMLNNFICHSNNYYDNIRNNEDKYVYKYTNEYLKDPFIIKVKDSFISKNNENIALEKIGIWAKYSFWFLETNRTAEFQKYTHSVISDVINIRNITEHRNSNKVIPQYTLKQIAYWQNSIEAKFSYIDLLLTTIMSTIKGF